MKNWMNLLPCTSEDLATIHLRRQNWLRVTLPTDLQDKQNQQRTFITIQKTL